MAIAGDVRDLKLDNVTYEVIGGSDLSRKTGKYTKEALPTSGKPIIKVTKQNEDVEGVEVQGSGATRQNIRDLSNRLDDFNIVYIEPDGTVNTGEGQITITADSTQDGKLTITLMPTSGWVAIVV